MLSEWEKSVLKNNRIDEDDVAEVTSNYIVKMKDGSEHQICEVYSRVR